MARSTVERAMLVYQAGIANVFAVRTFNLTDADARQAYRLTHGNFRTCEAYARGLSTAGVVVRSAACNMAGDIVDAEWTQDLSSAPWSDYFQSVNANG